MLAEHVITTIEKEQFYKVEEENDKIKKQRVFSTEYSWLLNSRKSAVSVENSAE